MGVSSKRWRRWGSRLRRARKRVIGVLGGGGRSGQLIPALIELYQQGRFPFDRLVRYYAMDQIEQALADSASGDVIKPILRMPH